MFKTKKQVWNKIKDITAEKTIDQQRKCEDMVGGLRNIVSIIHVYNAPGQGYNALKLLPICFRKEKRTCIVSVFVP